MACRRSIPLSVVALLLLAQSAAGLHTRVLTAPLLRVRGGFFPRSPATVSLSAVPTPVLLDEILADTRHGNGGSKAVPGQAPDALQVFRKVVGFVWVPNLRARLLVIAALMALVLSKSLNVLVPFTLKRAVDSLEASSRAATAAGASAAATTASVPAVAAFTPLLLLYAATRLGVSLSNELRTICFTRVSQRSQRAFATELFAKLHSLDATFHNAHPTGYLTVAFGRAINGFRSLLFQLLFSILPTALELGLSCTILARRFSPTLAAVTLLTFALYAAWTAFMVEVRIRLRKRLAKLDNAKAAYLVDSLSGTEVVKLMGTQAAELSRFDRYLLTVARTMVRSTELGALLNAGQATIFGGGLLACMLIAARGCASGALSIGDVVAVNGLLLQLSRPMDFIGYTVSEIRQSLVDMDAMLRVLASPSATADAAAAGIGRATAGSDTGSSTAPSTRTRTVASWKLEAGEAPLHLPSPVANTPPSVAFERVTFSYPNASAPALNDVSFAAPAGGTTALVGLSGSGKSTCLRLVSRLCAADSGTVRLWGRDVAELPADQLRASVGVIPQEPWLADDTVLWNLRMGNLNATDAQIDAAVAAASLAHTVRSLPEGYLTRVGERGARFSGGEKQRMMVARALLRDAPLLLADEPTASADALTEAALVDSLRSGTAAAARLRASSGEQAGEQAGGQGRGLGGERTLLVVVHRLAALCPNADHIVVFRAGRVVEQGRHADLLKRGGEYSMLWRAQAAEEVVP